MGGKRDNKLVVVTIYTRIIVVEVFEYSMHEYIGLEKEGYIKGP